MVSFSIPPSRGIQCVCCANSQPCYNSLVKLYKFKFRILQSFSQPSLHLYSLPSFNGYHGSDMLREWERKKSDVAVLSQIFKLLLLLFLFEQCVHCNFSLWIFIFRLKKNRNIWVVVFASGEPLYLLFELALGLAFSYARFGSVS